MSTVEVIEWRAPEYTFHPKTDNWYWGVALAGLALMLFALFTLNFLLVILVVVATFAVLVYGARQPQVVKFAVTHRGVRFHNRVFPYDRLKSFWIIETTHHRKLIVESDRFVLPHIVLPIADQVNAENLRKHLLLFLPEARQEESLADLLSDYFGF